MPKPLTLEETELIAESLRNHARLVEKLAEHDLLPGPASDMVPETMEQLARRVEEQTAS